MVSFKLQDFCSLFLTNRLWYNKLPSSQIFLMMFFKLIFYLLGKLNCEQFNWLSSSFLGGVLCRWSNLQILVRLIRSKLRIPMLLKINFVKIINFIIYQVRHGKSLLNHQLDSNLPIIKGPWLESLNLWFPLTHLTLTCMIGVATCQMLR